MKYLSVQITNLYAFLVCLGLFGAAFYLQFAQGLEPCPLCIIQRVVLAIIGLLFFTALFCKRWLSLINHMLLLMIGLLGSGVAARQVWLQHLPADQVPTCGPGLSYMLENIPLTQTIKLVFTGSGECAKVQWQFLGLSIPEWTFLFFVGFVLLAAINFCRQLRQSKR